MAELPPPPDTALERRSFQPEMEILSPLEAIALSEKPYLQRWRECVVWEMTDHWKKELRHSVLGALLAGLLAWLDGNATGKDIYYPAIGFLAVLFFKIIFTVANAPSEIEKLSSIRQRQPRNS